MKSVTILSDYTGVQSPNKITITESNAGNIEVSIYASDRPKSFILAGAGGGSRFWKNGTEIYLKFREIIELCADEVASDKYDRTDEYIHYSTDCDKDG